MTESQLNEQIFDSKIWKKDSQDNKEDSSYITEKSEFCKNKINTKNKKIKKGKNDSLNSNTNSNSNSNGNNNSNDSDGNNKNKEKVSNINPSIQKKLSLPINSIPFSLKNKKDLNKKDKNKPIETKNIFQNLPTYTYKNKDNNITLLEKIKEKVSKERKTEIENKKKKNIENKKNNKINSKDNKIIKKEQKNILEDNKNSKNNSEQKIKDNNEDYEEEEELEDEADNEILPINKVASIDIKSNFMPTHYYSTSNPQFYSNSNNSNSNSNKSFTKKKCYTESDDSFTKSFLFDLPSGRSNNSGNTNFSNNTDRNYPGTSRFKFANTLNNNININNNINLLQGKNRALMGSFLSTGANSYSHSGQRFDTSNSNESGQSPHNFNVIQRQLSNNNLNNNINVNNVKNNNIFNNINNNYMMNMNTHINPLDRYSSTFNSNEMVFKQPFSINTSAFYKPNKNNLYSNNSEPKEKQIINLDDIARGIEKRTTIMIRNVPIKYNNEVLEKELEFFNGKFDCLYMPFDYENGGNKGYAFLNLINPYHVLLFYEYFQGKCWSFFESKKICELNFANFQGINEIKKHAKNYRGTNKPVFYINTNNNYNTNIEVPKKYLQLILEKNPNLKYYENKMLNTIVINSFN